jgi:hypothetical protein
MNRFPHKARTIAQIEGDLDHFLICCRPNILAITTQEELERRFSKVDKRKIQYKLAIAKQRRAAELAAL